MWRKKCVGTTRKNLCRARKQLITARGPSRRA
jgi:hypothetical protein